MDLSAAQYFAIALIVFGSSIVQGMVGFASGLFGIPLLLLAGLELEQAVMFNLVAAFVQSVIGCYKLREHIDLAISWRPNLIRFLTLPIGVFALGVVNSLRSEDAITPVQVKQLIGLIIFAIIAAQWLLRVKPRDELHPMWEVLAFGVSGLVAGFCAMGGPPMALWIMAHKWSAAKSRVFLFLTFAMSVIPQAGLMYLRFGQEILVYALLGLMGIVFMLAGTLVGLHIGGMLPKSGLRRVVYFLLIVIALSAIFGPYLPGPAASTPTAHH